MENRDVLEISMTRLNNMFFWFQYHFASIKQIIFPENLF